MKRQIMRSFRKVEQRISSARSCASRFVRTKSNYYRQYTVPATVYHSSSESDDEDNVFGAVAADEPTTPETPATAVAFLPCEFCHLAFAEDQLTRHQARCRRGARLTVPTQTAAITRTRSEADVPRRPTPSAPPASPAAARAATSAVDDYPTPENLICPITLCLFEDPVLASDGHTYDRAAITQCIRGQGKSPVTRQSLKLNELLPNRLVKKMVDEFRVECERRKSHFKYRLEMDLKKSDQISSLKARNKIEYRLEWLKRQESLNNNNTVLVHFKGENAEKLALINCKLPKHPHLVATLGRVEHSDEGILVVREHAVAPTLTELIADNAGALPNSLVDLILYQVASALECLAANDVVHGHLTTDNILVYQLDDVLENVVVKLTNVSEYLIHQRSADSEETQELAPEVLSNQRYSEKSDVFAFGALALAIYKFETDRQALFDQCLAADVEARPTFHQIAETMKQLTEEEKCVSDDSCSE